VGLVTADDFRKARELVDEEKKASERETAENRAKQEEGKRNGRELKRKAIVSALSFREDEEEGEEEVVDVPKKRLTKNPNADTSFLPDRERDAAEATRRRELELEWLEEQERIKDEVSCGVIALSNQY
jgi:protein FAM50